MHKTDISRIMQKAALFCFLFAFTGNAAGCSLLNVKEEEHSIKIVNESVEASFDLAMTDIRDVVFSDHILCTYTQLSEEKYTFEKNGRVAGVYVKEGDEVTKGTLLGNLDISSMQRENSELEQSIELTNLNRSHAEEKIEYYQSLIDSKAINILDREDYRLKIMELNEDIRNYDSANQLAKDKIERNLVEIERAKIYASVDGTVSFVKRDLQGSDAISGDLVFKIMDSSVCAFQATDKTAASYMTPGFPVTIDLSTGVSYSAEVHSIDEKKGIIDFYLDEPDYSLAVGTRGSISIVLDEKKGVLSVPNTAVYSTDEFSYVYILTEEGVREIKKIETGLIGDNYVEVLSGLELYDSVIRKKN